LDESGNTIRSIYSVKANLYRLEVMSKETVGPVIVDLKSGIQQSINPPEKSYVEIDLLKSEVTGMENSEPSPKFMPTGETETIAGHSCEHYRFEDQQKTDICLAKGLGYIGTDGDYSGWVQQFLKNRKLESDPEFKKLMEGGVIPLKVSHVENGQVVTNMEVVAIERKPIDDALLKVPAGYQKMTGGSPQR
jgi:hypothetical protein